MRLWIRVCDCVCLCECMCVCSSPFSTWACRLLLLLPVPFLFLLIILFPVLTGSHVAKQRGCFTKTLVYSTGDRNRSGKKVL